jgi:ABC-type phosphate transport system substrate-binding protein
MIRPLRSLPRHRGPAWTGTVIVMSVLAVLLGTSPATAGTYTALQGSGSSWAAVALNQWANDLEPNGLHINYNEDGSASGRADWENGQSVDFVGSDPPFRNGQDELAGSLAPAESPNWNYSYVPDVAGGTAFMYHLTVGGHLVTNLRLSEETIMKIFTGQITNWDDPEITQDYGKPLPDEPIIPVVRSDGSGATYFLTRWMKTMFPQQWNAFCERVHPGIKLPCPQTEFYPENWPNVKPEYGSNAVSVYISSSYGEGAIGYDEYAYALNANWPVVAIENPAGYDVLPTASNVAVALTKAQIYDNPNLPDFLQQNLNNVYTNMDPRSYPLSSYSYLIVPRDGPSSTAEPFFSQDTSGNGRSLSTFIDFFLCQGQQQAAALGYSPLPYNLVHGAFLQVQKIPGTIGAPDINNYGACNNPTFTQGGKNVLLATAPYPTACQKATAPLTCTTGSNGKTDDDTGAAGSKTGKSGKGTPASGATGTTGGNGNTGGSAATGGDSGTGGTGTGEAQNADITGSVVNVPGNGADRIMLAVITALGVAIAVAAPPTVAAYLRRRRRSAP